VLTKRRGLGSGRHGQRPFYWILGIGFVVGLAAHVGGFLLKTSVTTEPLLLVAELVYALGWALWTGVVLVVFVQIWPAPDRSQPRGNGHCVLSPNVERKDTHRTGLTAGQPELQESS
jgi:hypothetical protein